MTTKARILLFDIENSPNKAWVWGKYEQDVIAYVEEWYMLSYAYKWLGERAVRSKGLIDYRGYFKDKTNDKKLVTDLWKLLNEADIVIAHNGDRFDIRKANARFLAHGLPPPSSYKTVDTLKIARKYFMMNSNKLNDLSNYLGIGTKVETGGFALWLGCMDGDKTAWKQMLKYNKQDITLLEKVYLKLRHWSEQHPNLNVLNDTPRNCPTCGFDKLRKEGYRITKVGKYRKYQCQNCGSWSTGEKIKEEKIIIR